MANRAGLFSESMDALPINTAVVDQEGTILQTNRAWRQFGEENDIETQPDTVGTNYLDVCKNVDNETAKQVFDGLTALLAGHRDVLTVEYPCHSPIEQRWFLLWAVPFVSDGQRHAVIAHFNITKYILTERQIARQRDQLEALDHLHEVVRETTHLVIDQSTRTEIEQTICTALTGTQSYDYAWLGEIDGKNNSIEIRATSTSDFGDDTADTGTASDPSGESADDATAVSGFDIETALGGDTVRQALWTRETQTSRVGTDRADFDWAADSTQKYDFQSIAAVPIVHDSTLYGIFCIYVTRDAAFTESETAMLTHLGEVVGHAIAAVERKQALMSEELIEVELEVPNRFTAESPPNADWEFTIDQTVVGPDGTHLAYGTTANADLEAIDTIVDQRDDTTLTVLREDDENVRILFHLTEPPVVSLLAAQGWATKQSVIINGDCYLTVHLPAGDDVRQMVELVSKHYPETSLLARRQIHSKQEPTTAHSQTLLGGLTERQRTVLKAAHAAGYFEWPRDSSGEEVAALLGISPATFHQHLRICEKKLIETIFAESPIVT